VIYEGEDEVKEVHVEGRPAVRVVKVRSEPVDVEVYVNGEYRGRTPVYIKLEVGKEHEVVMKKEGYKEIRKRVMIPEKGKMVEWEVKMKPLAVLKVRSEPEGAKVYLDGEYIGKTPLEVEREEGIEGIVEIEKEGYYKEERLVKVMVGEEKELMVKLKGKVARLMVRSEPEGAKVYLGSRYIGETPLEELFERDVEGMLKVEKEGYEVVEMKVSIKRGEEKLLEIKLCIETWQKCLGGSDIDEAHSIQQTSDGGYIVAGWTYSNDSDVYGNHGWRDIWVVKLDENGNIQWQKCLGGSDSDKAYSIQQTSDGGYIVAGLAYSNNGDVYGNHGESDMWIVKLDENGNL